MAEITRAEWEAKGLELFGADLTKHRFVCPSCGNEMSMERARTEFAQHMPAFKAGNYRIEQECVGRHVPGVGCDWAAYGLFRGPLLVRDDVGAIPAFDYAGKPFTSKPPRVRRG